MEKVTLKSLKASLDDYITLAQTNADELAEQRAEIFALKSQASMLDALSIQHGKRIAELKTELLTAQHENRELRLALSDLAESLPEVKKDLFLYKFLAWSFFGLYTATMLLLWR